VERRLTVDSYLAGEETNRRQELAFGVLREPPAPGYNHQIVVGRLHVRLDAHVRDKRAGRVILSPIDVVLDRDQGLVVQPDLVFVSTERLHICTHAIWGAPDLVVEVLSTDNRRHDRTVKVEWYRQYGVRECWLVDPVARTIEVIDFSEAHGSMLFDGSKPIRSQVLPHLELAASAVFSD
jgi:Uma2 family endonuclease